MHAQKNSAGSVALCYTLLHPQLIGKFLGKKKKIQKRKLLQIVCAAQKSCWGEDEEGGGGVGSCHGQWTDGRRQQGATKKKEKSLLVRLFPFARFETFSFCYQAFSFSLLFVYIYAEELLCRASRVLRAHAHGIPQI